MLFCIASAFLVSSFALSSIASAFSSTSFVLISLSSTSFASSFAFASSISTFFSLSFASSPSFFAASTALAFSALTSPSSSATLFSFSATAAFAVSAAPLSSAIFASFASHSFFSASTAFCSVSSSFFSSSLARSTSFSDSLDARSLSSSSWLFFRFSTDSWKHFSFSAIVDFIVTTSVCRLSTSSTCWRSCSISAFSDAFSSFSWLMIDSLSSMSLRSFVACVSSSLRRSWEAVSFSISACSAVMRSLSALISSSLVSIEVCRSFPWVSRAAAFSFSDFSLSMRLWLNACSFLYLLSISAMSGEVCELIICSWSLAIIRPRALSTASLSFALLTLLSTLSRRASTVVVVSEASYA